MTALEKENKDDPDMGEMIDLELEALSNQLAERLAFGPERGGGASRTVGALLSGGTIDPPWASLCPLPLARPHAPLHFPSRTAVLHQPGPWLDLPRIGRRQVRQLPATIFSSGILSSETIVR